MTAQIADEFFYSDKYYSISAIEVSDSFFDIYKLGLEPHGMSTACYRGYVAYFAIDSRNRLQLTDLSTNNGNGKWEIPSINGVQPRIIKPDRLWGPYLHHRKLEYTGLQLPLSYSGGILITANFIQDSYIHMGFHSPWNYREVIELVFLDGICINTNKLSEVAEHRRKDELIVSQFDSKWIGKTFDLSYQCRYYYEDYEDETEEDETDDSSGVDRNIDVSATLKDATHEQFVEWIETGKIPEGLALKYYSSEMDDIPF